MKLNSDKPQRARRGKNFSIADIHLFYISYKVFTRDKISSKMFNVLFVVVMF